MVPAPDVACRIEPRLKSPETKQDVARVHKLLLFCGFLLANFMLNRHKQAKR